MRDATTPPPPSSRLRTPPTPKHGAGYYSFDPYEPRRSQRVHQRHIQSSLSRKATLVRTESSQTLSPPSSPVANLPTHQQTPARPTPVRQSLFTRNRPVSTTNNPLFDVFSTTSQLPTPASMLPTPNKTPHKRDTNALQSTARILNFKPTNSHSTMTSSRNKTKSRLTLDDDDAVHDDIHVFTDVQDRIPTVDDTEDNPFVGPRKTRGRGRAHTAPSSSAMEVDKHDTHEKGIYYVFRGKKILRQFQKPTDDPADSDVSTASNDSLKRKAGAAASRPLTRSAFKPRLLWPSANSDNDADEEALTDIDEDNAPPSASASFSVFGQSTKTPSKPAVARPTTPPSSHRQTRSAAEKMAMFASPQLDINHTPASPASTPMPSKTSQPHLFSGWPRSKGADAKVPRGEKRRGTMSEPDIPAKRSRSADLFANR